MTRPKLMFAMLMLALLALLLARRHRHEAPAPAAASSTPEPAGLHEKPIHVLRERDSNGASEYLVRNLAAGPIEVHCSLAQADNVRTEPALPLALVLGAKEERMVTQILSLDEAKPASASMDCTAIIGDPRARPAEDVAYALPFPAGVDFTLDQGFNGSFSHHDDESRYSLDFGVPEGTAVLAARAGVVMQVEDEFRGSGTDAAKYGDRANYVRVLHDDGSMALYAHLAPESMLRQPGDRLAVGQLLGKSGNTGFSTGPHLHFSVQRNAGMALRSIPFTMAGVDISAARH